MCPSPASRAASCCVSTRPCGDVSTTAAGRPRVALMCCTARASGSGFSTIPGPPPYGASNIAGKIVTMSNFTAAASSGVHVQQAARRIDNDAPAGDVDLHPDRGGQGQLHFAAPLPDHQPLGAWTALDGTNDAHCPPIDRGRRATNQLVVVIRP